MLEPGNKPRGVHVHMQAMCKAKKGRAAFPVEARARRTTDQKTATPVRAVNGQKTGARAYGSGVTVAGAATIRRTMSSRAWSGGVTADAKKRFVRVAWVAGGVETCGGGAWVQDADVPGDEAGHPERQIAGELADLELRWPVERMNATDIGNELERTEGSQSGLAAYAQNVHRTVCARAASREGNQYKPSRTSTSTHAHSIRPRKERG
ncbi:hypothetical protein AcW2_003956 [Taiwanofungus camphoratus]|nr:hypothetical protein AcW2_003956 [Antrodia cinnamomea]